MRHLVRGSFCRVVLIIAICCAVTLNWASAATRATGLDAFKSAYRCTVTNLLMHIHARGDQARQDNRFLILGMRNTKARYAQCAFYDNDTHMMCEVASGYFANADSAPPPYILDTKAMDSVMRLGFSTDGSHGNFKRVVDIDGIADYAVVADLLLSAMYEVHGARLRSRIELTAPLVFKGEAVLSPMGCKPDV